MRKLLNTLYVLSEEAYLSLDGETVEVSIAEKRQNIPLITLESIVCFSYKGASPALMGKCAKLGISITFLTPNGRYLATVNHLERGNVLLRREQYRIADSETKSAGIARSFLVGKLYNTKYVLARTLRDHPLQVNKGLIEQATCRMADYMKQLRLADEKSSLMGIEGNAAGEYFSCFNEMVLKDKDFFLFDRRNRRPPTDPVNSLLSFAYTLLGSDCASALHSVGLDPFVGFLHVDRSGRESLALDLMEELRPIVADRFVLYLINNRILTKADFLFMENGAVYLKDEARKVFLNYWQEHKREELRHPFLEEKINWGLVPYVQSLLLARHIRGDIDAYPPMFWK